VALSEIGLQGDAQQTTLGGGIHSQIESGSGYGAVDHVLHLAGRLFEYEKITGA